MDKLQVVEWSPSQQCFHVQSMRDMLRDNLAVFHGHSMTDYLCIGIFNNEKDLQAFLDKAHEIADR